MGVNARLSFKYTLVQYLGTFLGFLNTIIILPSVLSPDEFGVTRLFLSIALILTQVSSFGVGKILLKFQFLDKDKERSNLLLIGLVVVAVGSIVVSMAIWGFEDKIGEFYSKESPLFKDYIILLLPYIIGGSVVQLIDSWLRLRRKDVLSGIVIGVFGRLFNTASGVLALFGVIDFEEFMILFSLNQVLVLLLFLMIATRKQEVSNIRTPEDFTWKLMRSVYSFGGLTVLSGIMIFSVNKIDLIIIGQLAGLESVAQYSISVFFVSFLFIPSQALIRVTNVELSKALSNSDGLVVNRLYKRTAMVQLIMGGAIYLLILSCYNVFVDWFVPQYQSSYLPFLILGVGKVLDISFGTNGAILEYGGRQRQGALLALAFLVTSVCLNYLLIPTYGINGAAIATLCSWMIYNFLKALAVYKYFGLWPFGWSNLGVMAYFFTAMGIVTYLNWSKLGGEYLVVLVGGVLALSFLWVVGVKYKQVPELSKLWLKAK